MAFKKLKFEFLYSRFSERFELPLLIQSIVMNVTMFLMIHLCVKVRRDNAIMKTRDRVFAGNYKDETIYSHYTKRKEIVLFLR